MKKIDKTFKQVLEDTAQDLIDTKPKFEGLRKSTVSVQYADMHGNYTSVGIKKGKSVFTGYAKCNPNCDEVDLTRGFTIAISRALSRILDPNDIGNII